MSDHPGLIVPVDHVEPVPRRIRAHLGGVIVVDTLRASYVWEHPAYPQWYIPVADVAPGCLLDEGSQQRTSRGTARRHGLRAGGLHRPGAAVVLGDDAVDGLAATVRFEWDALDSWFEEDELVHVHPRSPYTRVDALRSSRHVTVAVDGVTLADSHAPVMVFETGLPTRYYLDRCALDPTHLVPSDTVTSCPYKGTTSAYWSARTPAGTTDDVAWSYDFPTRQLLPIAGLVAFYDERVDLTVDGRRLERPPA